MPLLLFADDIVLASTDPKLSQRLLNALSDWCTASGLCVNTDKTRTLVGGVVPRANSAGNGSFAHHNYELDYRGTLIPVVRLFKYLGLHFDGSSSTRSMLQHRLGEARRAWGRLMGKLVSKGWQDRATRLVLFDAYVRSVLLYGSAVWGNSFVHGDTGALVVGPSEELGIFYRRCLRTLLGVGSHVRNEVVYALTGRLPVHVHLSKALLQYARSLAAHPRRATNIYQWAQVLGFEILLKNILKSSLLCVYGVAMLLQR